MAGGGPVFKCATVAAGCMDKNVQNQWDAAISRGVGYG